MSFLPNVVILLVAVVAGITATHYTDGKPAHYSHHNHTSNHTNGTGWQPRDETPVAMPIPHLPILPKDHDEDDHNKTGGIPHLAKPVYSSDNKVKWFPRIIGGMPSALGQFPSKVSVQLSQSHMCGASLIDQSHVLTAAHCVTNERAALLPLAAIRLMAGDVFISAANTTPSRQFRNPTHIFVHTAYNFWTMENDIAVVRFAPPLTGLLNIAQISLSPTVPTDGTTCTIAGWGVTQENNTVPSPTLMHAAVSIININTCNSSTSYDGMIRQGMLCAGVMAGGVDSCQGDSGGGLICNNMVAGVVSFGYGCGRPNFPGVYVDVSHYVTWINQMMAWTGTAVPTPTTVIPLGGGSAVVASIVTTLMCFVFATLKLQV